MGKSKEQLKAIFDAKAAELIDRLEQWFYEETAPIDGDVDAGSPAEGGGSIVGKLPVIDSKQMVDATIITKEVLGIDLPPAIIAPGGYFSFKEMIDDIVPKLEQVFTGQLKAKACKPVKELAIVEG